MRDPGTVIRVPRRRFFSLLWQRLLEPGHGYVLIAEHEGRPAAAAVFLTAGETVVYKYGASDERLWDVRANHVLFHEAIRRSCDEGLRSFDFGRTDFADRGLREFKLGWGATTEPQPMYVRAVRGATPRFDVAAPGIRFLTGLWRSLPRNLADALGPAVCRRWLA